jgi:hypothetical protein
LPIDKKEEEEQEKKELLVSLYQLKNKMMSYSIQV